MLFIVYAAAPFERETLSLLPFTLTVTFPEASLLTANVRTTSLPISTLPMDIDIVELNFLIVNDDVTLPGR